MKNVLRFVQMYTDILFSQKYLHRVDNCEIRISRWFDRSGSFSVKDPRASQTIISAERRNNNVPDDLIGRTIDNLASNARYGVVQRFAGLRRSFLALAVPPTLRAHSRNAKGEGRAARAAESHGPTRSKRDPLDSAKFFVGSRYNAIVPCTCTRSRTRESMNEPRIVQRKRGIEYVHTLIATMVIGYPSFRIVRK